MLKWLKKKDKVPPRVHVVEPKHLTKEAKKALRSNFLRHGMWVSTPTGVGIIKDVNGSMAEVALTDEKGYNKALVMLDLAQITQADYEQIPSSRIHHDRDFYTNLGYL